MSIAVAVESPLQDDVRELVAELNATLLELTPPEFVFHMTVEQMAEPTTTVFIAREDGRAVGGGALKRHEGGVGEVKPRLPQSTVLHHERYDATNEAAQRKVYDAEMSRFSARHELQAATWTQRVLNRLAPLKSMNGRETIRASLAKLGFEIR